MKVVILAGGFGTRISEESHRKPKPMVEIGENPILLHIMKYFASYGHTEFIICAGYKQQIIKEWFAGYFINTSDVTFDLRQKDGVFVHRSAAEPWRVTVADTGLGTMTGGRLKRIGAYLENQPFFLTYGDGVADIDLQAELAFHRAHGKLATSAAVHPDSRFGVLDLQGERVCAFREKSEADSGWVNGGYMILQPEVLSYIQDDFTVFEEEPLCRLAAEGELMAYRHSGFWQCMDTMRDRAHLESLLATGKAPWVRKEQATNV